MNLSLLAPDILDSPFAHTLHVLLIGGVIVYGWQSVTALVRKPKSVGKALRKAVNAAWLAVLFLLITQPNPVPYLRVAAAIAAVLIVLKVWDRATAPAKQEDLLTSGPAGAIGREAERSTAAVGIRRD
ncbi:MAG: hypothetical protein M3Y30_08785 [Gemmatimonadota bacterium]|nr:hypothetical protein [Gemmatimonadota bacterium]